MKTLYTIGHSIHPAPFFLNILLKHQINCIVDVRSIPYSKHVPQYNSSPLKRFLKKNNIYYVFMGKEFGARQTDKLLQNPTGYVDFEKVIAGNEFKNGIYRVKNGLNKGLTIAFMCTEKDPIDCHRTIMVARAFNELNYQILNIREDGTLENQDQINERLLNIYFPQRDQQSIVDLLEGENNKKALLKEALRKRNLEIAYHDEKYSNEALTL